MNKKKVLEQVVLAGLNAAEPDANIVDLSAIPDRMRTTAKYWFSLMHHESIEVGFDENLTKNNIAKLNDLILDMHDKSVAAESPDSFDDVYEAMRLKLKDFLGSL